MHENVPHTHEHRSGLVVHSHRPHSPLRTELITHTPFSVASVAIGLVVAGLICFITPDDVMDPGGTLPGGAHVHDAALTVEPAGEAHMLDEAGHADHDHTSGFRAMFHLFHPLHMFFSAAATTAMFWRYDKRLIRAIIVGLIGAIVVCGISDIIMPHISLLILHKNIPLHICVIEHPGLVMPFAVVGVLVGLLAAEGVTRSTIFSHSLHVFASTMASLFYMIQAYGRLAWLEDMGWIFFFIILAVMVPCCLSDIVFPVAMSRPAREMHAETTCCH